MDAQVDILYEEANQLLTAARQEMLRSAEDTVTHTACFQSRQAIINYLKAFLLQNEAHILEPMTMDSLLEQCQAVDGRFDLINFEHIHCRFEVNHQDYCLDIDQVKECLRTGRQIKNMVEAVAPDY